MYENQTYENIKAAMLAEITLTDKREGSFVNDMLSVAAMEGEKLYTELEHSCSYFSNNHCNNRNDGSEFFHAQFTSTNPDLLIP